MNESDCRWTRYRPVSPATRLLCCCWSLGMLTCALLWLLLLPAHLAPPNTRYLLYLVYVYIGILAYLHLYNGSCYSNLTP